MNLNGTDFVIRVHRVLAADINTDATKNAAYLGEPFYATDTDMLYNFDGSKNIPLPSIRDNVSLTAKVAAIGATNLLKTNLAGLYRVSYYLETTTLDVTAGTITVNFAYTDEAGATTQGSAALILTALGRTSGVLYMRVSNTSSISYSTTLVGVIGTSQYALFISAEKLL